MKKIAFVGLLLAVGTAANAGIVGNAIRITATNSSGSGTWSLPAPTQSGWDSWSWTNRDPIVINSATGAEIARINNLNLQFIADPVISVNFVIVAGGAATAFAIDTGELVFPAINNPAIASASAGITVTDLNGNLGGFTGGFAGGTKSYRADYNGLVPGGTQYAALIDNTSVAFPFFSETGSGNASGGIVGSVTSMSAGFSFTLSANDSAAGTSVFQIVPTPGALAVLGLAGLSVARRRR